jgi:two-component system, LytTR family, sensor histidine kinase AlgZ
MRDKLASSKEFFLPDFCQTQSVFLVVLISEILAVIFTLINIQPEVTIWYSLGLYSISIQIVTLFSVALLCLLRPFLENRTTWFSALISLSVILLTSLIFSLVAIKWYWLNEIDLSDTLQRHLIVRNLLICGLIGSIALRYFYLQQQYRKQLLLEASARLEALQARIRPHFLFNSMNVIASLTRIDPAKAEAAIEDLSDLFRATLDNKQDLIEFSKELKNSECYLAIEKLRLGERLKIEREVEQETLAILVPPLSLQPLLENAVYHGIQMLPEGGKVTLKAKIENDMLVIQVINPRVQDENKKGHGMALKNISQRLDVIYSNKATLTRSINDDIYCAEMHIPLLLDKKS